MLTLSTTDSALEVRERERERERECERKGEILLFVNVIVQVGIFSTLKNLYKALYEMKYYSQKCQILVTYIEMKFCVCVLSLKKRSQFY